MPDFDFAIHAFTSSSVGSGTCSSSVLGSPCKFTAGSPGRAENFSSRNEAHKLSCCSLLVIAFPCKSRAGCTKRLKFYFEDKRFANLNTSDELPTDVAFTMSIKVPFTKSR